MDIRYRKIFIIIIVLITFSLFYGCNKGNNNERETSIRDDYITYKGNFESIISLFPDDDYYKITSENYDKSNNNLCLIFEELQYSKIYSDYKGNVFFDKFGDGLSFHGLVYLKSPEYVIGIPKTKSEYISEDKKWCVYYAHGL